MRYKNKLKRFSKIGIAEWFEEAFRSALLEQWLSVSFVATKTTAP
ncbi:hypothetical protein [Rhizobium tubonense]